MAAVCKPVFRCVMVVGLRRVSSLASSVFWLPLRAHANFGTMQILHRVSQVNDEIFDNCLLTRVDDGTQPPVNSDIQRTWDKVIVDAEFNDLLSRYSELYHRARLLAAAAPHSVDWLHTFPISACGLHLEDNAIRVAVIKSLCYIRLQTRPL